MIRLFISRFILQSIGSFLALVFGVLTARWLGPEGKGLFSLILLFSHIGSMIGTMGLNDAAPYIHNRLGVKLGELKGIYLLFLSVWGVLLSFFTGIAVLTLGHCFAHQTIAFSLALLTGMLTFVRLWNLMGKGLLLAEVRYKHVMRLDFAGPAFSLFILFAIVALWNVSVILIIISVLISASLIALLLIWITFWRESWLPPLRRLKQIFLDSISYGFYTNLRVIGATLMWRADYFLVASLLGIRAVGLYSVANIIAEIVLRIPDVSSWILLPKVSRKLDSNANETTSLYLRLTVLITGVAAILLGSIVPSTLPLVLTKQFQDAVPVTLVLLVGCAVSSIYKVLSADFIGRGQAIHASVATWGGAILMLSFDIIVIPQIGLIGAALGSVVGYTFAAGYSAFVFSRLSNLAWRNLLLPTSADKALLMSIIRSFRIGACRSEKD